MTPRPTLVRIPQPCAESWAAMTPTATGRHCAKCQKTVVDFTHKTDAEILAALRQAAGETCGRLRTDQLGRPLLPANPAGRSSNWRTWLAAALAAWSLRPAETAAAPAPAPTHRTPTRAAPKRRPSTLATKYVRGTVRDSATGAPLVGVAVFLRGENRMASTDSAGRFRLRLSPRRPRGGRALVLHYAGYVSRKVRLPATTRATTTLQLALAAESRPLEVAVVGQDRSQQRTIIMGMMPLPGSYSVRTVRQRQPWPWHPRAFYYWGKHWLTKPFRG